MVARWELRERLRRRSRDAGRFGRPVPVEPHLLPAWRRGYLIAEDCRTCLEWSIWTKQPIFHLSIKLYERNLAIRVACLRFSLYLRLDLACPVPDHGVFFCTNPFLFRVQ
jgi:hypothetical protein